MSHDTIGVGVSGGSASLPVQKSSPQQSDANARSDRQVRVRIRHSLVVADPLESPIDPSQQTALPNDWVALGHLGVVDRAENGGLSHQDDPLVLVVDPEICHELVVSERDCIDLSDVGMAHVDTTNALMAAPAARALCRVRGSGIRLGDAALVIGDDVDSLFALQWAKRQGALPVLFATHGPRELLELAAQLGADVVVDLQKDKLTPAVLSEVGQQTVRVVFCSPSATLLLGEALGLLAHGGRVVLLGGTSSNRVTINLYPDLHRRELELVGAGSMPEHGDLETNGVERWQNLVPVSLSFLRRSRLEAASLIAGSISAREFNEGSSVISDSPTWKAWNVGWTDDE